MSPSAPPDGYFRALLESTSDIVALVGPDGTIRYVNGAVERMLGWTPEERVGRSTFELVHPDDAPKVARAFQRLAEGPARAERVSCRLSHRGGGWRMVEATGTARMDDPGLGGIVITVRDVTRAQRAEAAARESEARFGQLASTIEEVFWLVDRRGWRVLYVSPAFERVWGRAAADLLADASVVLGDLHADDRVEGEGAVARFFDAQPEREYRIVRPDGQVRWLRTRSFAIRDEAGAAFRVAGISEDVTERRVRDEMLQRLALRDPLTGLPNRAALLHRIERALGRMARSGEGALSLLFVDLDRFKLINDSLGHGRGDELLCAIAVRLAECVRPVDMVARLGGDEFGVLLHDTPRPADAARVAERIHAAFARPFEVGGARVFAACSIGIVPAEGYRAAGDLLRDADIAMDRAKRAGRGVYRVFDAAMHDEAVARLQLETDLRHALERNEFVLFYQPVVSLASGEVAGVEALLRWRHPERGVLAPAAFLEVAEEIGSVIPLGWAAVREAGAQLLRWDAAVPGAPRLGMSVNLSARHFALADVAARVEEALAGAGCPPDRLRLEITESVLVQGPHAERAFRELKALGVELHIDDFGTGYSSLSYLDRFPVDTVKVDRSLVARIGPAGEGAEIVEAVVRLAHGLGMRVTAEGVETPAQLARLREMGCDFAQGFLFAPALPADEVEALLREGRRW